MRTIICFVLFFSAQLFAFDSQFWADIQKFPVPQWRPAETPETTKARAIYFEGEIFKGKPTEVFAYYCTPGILTGDLSKDKNLPAVVCVHGGGGRAYCKWVELWASKGYAAIAIDWRGNGSEPKYKNPTPEQRKRQNAYFLTQRKHLENGGPEHTPQTTSLDDGKAERDAWPYQAVGAIVRAHSLVRSFKEVDADRTAITGISWGGYLTSLTSAIDGRFKAAVPVYGCGFLFDFPQNWAKSVGSKKADRWIELFDPSKSLEVEKIPMLFVNSPTDKWYPLSIWTKSAALARAQTLIIAGLKHSHEHGWEPPEIEAFIASKINGAPPFVNLGDLRKNASTVSCAAPDAAKIKDAQLFYTVSEGDSWKDFKWQSAPAKLDGGKISAVLPSNARAAYISITDTLGRRITTNALIF